jgi:hypothetical protein
MSSIITAGNATNGLAISADNTGALEFKTGASVGTTALTLSTSQLATFSGNIQTAGLNTYIYPLIPSTATTVTSNTALNYLNLPSWAKRVSIQLNTVTMSAGSSFAIQLITGASTIVTAGYASAASGVITGGATVTAGPSSRYQVSIGTTNTIFTGVIRLQNISDAIWILDSTLSNNSTFVFNAAGTCDAVAAVTGVRITTLAGTATFSSGSINILYE